MGDAWTTFRRGRSLERAGVNATPNREGHGDEKGIRAEVRAATRGRAQSLHTRENAGNCAFIESPGGDFSVALPSLSQSLSSVISLLLGFDETGTQLLHIRKNRTPLLPCLRHEKLATLPQGILRPCTGIR